MSDIQPVPFTIVNPAGEITVSGICDTQSIATIAPEGHKVFPIQASAQTHRFNGTELVLLTDEERAARAADF